MPSQILSGRCMKKENKTQKRQQAKKLVRQYEISLPLAWSVVNNTCSLHDALVQSRTDAERGHIQAQYDLNDQEMEKIQSGEASLTDILVQKQHKEHIDDTDAEPFLAIGFSGYFWVHHKGVFRGEIIGCSQYDVEFITHQGTFSLPKLHIKAFSIDEISDLSSQIPDVDPVVRIEERFRISNRVLYRFVLEETTLRMELLGGLTCSGILQQVGRYECVLAQEDGTTIILMRHALSRVDEVK